MSELDAIIQKVADKIDEHNRDIETLKGRPDPLDEAQIRAMVTEAINALSDDPEFTRKMRFSGQDVPSALSGSKYARWGLGPEDIEFLYDLQDSLAGQKRVSESGFYKGPSEELTRAFNEISDAVYIPMEQVREMDKKAIENMFPRVKRDWLQRLRGMPERINQDGYERALRAMDSAESGYGSQLIGAQYVGELWEAARPESTVFPLFDTFEMTDPTAYLPVESDLPEMLFVSESTTNSSSNYDTTKTGSQRVQVDAKKFVIHQMWSGELEEDSIIPFIPFLRRQSTLSVAHYSDSLLLNGDTTNAGNGNINLDDADPADTKHYLALDGLRHAAIVDNTGNLRNVAGAATPADFLELKKLMKDAAANVPMHWGMPRRMEDLVFVIDSSTYFKMIDFDEFVTVDKFGPRATILTGQVASIWGHAVISSEAMSLTEADGKVSTTAGNNTLGQILAANRRAFKVGWRRRIKLETERLPATDQTRIVYSLRLGFGRYSTSGAASGIEAAAVARNITV